MLVLKKNLFKSLKLEMLVLKLEMFGFRSGNVGFGNQKFWDGGRYIN
jgi:hypothetical protein